MLFQLLLEMNSPLVRITIVFLVLINASSAQVCDSLSTYDQLVRYIEAYESTAVADWAKRTVQRNEDLESISNLFFSKNNLSSF